MGILFAQRGRWNYDDNLKYKAALFAENFRQQDQQGREKDLKILDIYRYADSDVLGSDSR